MCIKKNMIIISWFVKNLGMDDNTIKNERRLCMTKNLV